MKVCLVHRREQPCDDCAIEAFLKRVGMRRVKQARFPTVLSFGEVLIDNMFHPWERPYAVTSREELRAECERRGLYSHYLRDSMHWHSGPRKWF